MWKIANRKKQLIFIIPAILIIIYSLFWIGDGIYEGKRVSDMVQKDLEEDEKEFQKRPDLVNCLRLMDKYYWDFRNYKKALNYAENCIRLNVDDTRRGWYVHMLMADIYKKDRKRGQACDHIRIAFNIAEHNTISAYYYEALDLQSLIDDCLVITSN